MMAAPRWFGLLGLATLGACGPGPNATVADLPSLTVGVGVRSAVEHGRAVRVVSIRIGYDEGAFKAAHDDECAVLDEDEVHGDVAGIALSIKDGEPDSSPSYRIPCGGPLLEGHGELSNDGAMHAVLQDSTSMVEAEFPAGAVVARRADPVDPPSWTFTRGSMITARWSQPADLVGLLPGGLRAYLDPPGVAEEILLPATLMSSDTIALEIPSDAPVGSAGLLVIVGSVENDSYFDRGVASSCVGADACTFWVSHTYSHDVTIE